jgi:hypothetical protein
METMITEFELAKSKATLEEVKSEIDNVLDGIGNVESGELLQSVALLEKSIDLKSDTFYKLGGEYYNTFLIPTLQKISMYIEYAREEGVDHKISDYLDEALSEIEYYFSENT